MRIFLTNDDGIDSPGLAALADRLSCGHELVVVAPDRDRSGASHSISVGKALDAHLVGKDRWSLSGTPADCVRVGVPALCPGGKPDLVVSGINLGANLGSDIILSGTVGAARHALLLGIPAIAISTPAYASPEDVLPAAAFIAANLDLLAQALSQGGFLNVNVPASGATAASVARPGRMRYATEIIDLDPGLGSTRRLMARSTLLSCLEDSSGDWNAASRGHVVLSGLGLWGPDPGVEARIQELVPGLAFQGR